MLSWRRVATPLKSSLLRQAGIYTVAHLISRVVPFLLLPILTRFLSPGDYGTIAMFLLAAVILDPFINVGLVPAATVVYYERGMEIARYVGTGLIVVVAVAIGWLVVLALVNAPLSEVTAVPGAWLLLVVPLVVARTTGSTLLAMLRVEQRPFQFSAVQIALSVGLVTLSLVLVVLMARDWRGRLEAELLAWGVLGVVSVLWMRRAGWLRLRFDRTYAHHLVKFGVPLIPHTLGAALIVQTDRLLLTNLVGVEETGLYAVAYQLTLVIELVAISLNNAYAPWLFRNLSAADRRLKRRIVSYTYLQFFALAGLAIVVAIAMPWFATLILGDRFHEATKFVGWFALGFLFSGMYYMVTNFIFFAQRTIWLAATTMFVALLNIPLTYVLIVQYGAVGAAQATAISLGLSFILTWIVSRRVYAMPWLLRD